MGTNWNEKIIMGVELEGYTILTPEYRISRKMAFHRRGTSEKGERFTRDWSIGTEYNSRPFSTIREGLFLLKTGLRKYNTDLYRTKTAKSRRRQIFLIGGWRDRFAGTHIHLSVSGEKMDKKNALSLSRHIHDHLPLILAIMANSPVWADRITEWSSTRVLRGSKTYFRPIQRETITSQDFNEITFNKAKKHKPPTLEVRIMDANIPEFAMAAACIIKACALRWRHRKKRTNQLSHFSYLRSRQEAAHFGMRGKLSWNGRSLSAADYLDRFVWTHRQEFKMMDIPQDLWYVFKLLKKGINGSLIIHEACHREYRRHPQTWQRRFAKKYVNAVNRLLSGNTIKDFIEGLGVRMPNLRNVHLGRKGLHLE